MEWNSFQEVQSNFVFPCYPGALDNPSFDAAQILSASNSNQWDGATSTNFNQFSSYDFPLEDTGIDSWRSMDTSYNLVPTWPEELAIDGPKLDTLGKGRFINGSGCKAPSSVYLGECLDDIQDCKMFGLDLVDDNFMNSLSEELSEEDIRAVLNTVEPSQQIASPCIKPEPFEDIQANLLNAPRNNIFYQNATEATNNLDAFGISLLSEDLSAHSSMLSQGCAASDSSKLVKPRGNITDSRTLADDVAKAKFLEATVLRELEAALSRINQSTRICFRDACYRLANDLKVPRDENKKELHDFHFERSFNIGSRGYKVEAVEKETNVIDRAIVNLLFNPCNGPSEMQTPHDFHTNRIQYM